MSAPSVTYTFTNGTTIDATQVNTNFTDLINGASDGTKDYTINSLTANGNLTFSGNGTFGSASGDDLTFNGSLASSIPVKANATYDIGASTTGLAGIYLGNNTRTTRIVAGTVTGSYTLTLPVAAPTKTGMIMTFDTNALATFRYTNKTTASKTTTYTATSDETVIPCDASGGAFTVTLPPVSGNSGLVFTIIKTDTSLANAVTIDGDGSETINGATTTTLNTQYESVKVMCDGSAWIIIERRIPSLYTSYTLTIGAVTSAPTPGTVTVNEARWKRIGDSMMIHYDFTQTVAGSAGTGVYLFPLPTGTTIDTAKQSVSTTVQRSKLVGPASGGITVVASGYARAYDTSNLVLVLGTDAVAWTEVSSTFIAMNNASVVLSFQATVPISGWNG